MNNAVKIDFFAVMYFLLIALPMKKGISLTTTGIAQKLNYNLACDHRTSAMQKSQPSRLCQRQGAA
jgi:hypothetical protein